MHQGSVIMSKSIVKQCILYLSIGEAEVGEWYTVRFVSTDQRNLNYGDHFHCDVL